jgi:type IV pilus assembly protein PilB
MTFADSERAPDPEPKTPETASTSPASLEDLLIRECGVTAKQVERARRIVSRLKSPKPLTEVLMELGQLTRSEHERIIRLYRSRLDLAEILREDGVLDDEGVLAFRRAKRDAPDGKDRQILVDGGMVEEEQYLKALSAKHGIPYLMPEVALLDEKLLEKTSFPYLLHHKVLPFRLLDGQLTVFMVEPLNSTLRAELERIFKVPIRPCCAPTAAIVAAIKRAEKRVRGGQEAEVTNLKYREIREVQEGEEVGAEAVRIVDHVLYRAIQMGASDVHIEPREAGVHVRVRVDGVLQPLTQLPASFAPRIAARVKVLCGADLAERRRHQDGRFFAKVDGGDVDMRVSTYASIFGETVVIRLLHRNRGLIPLEGLGFEPGIMRVLREVVLRSPSGMMLVTGPTGSGKTTTLYSFVDSLLNGRLKVITCEDPVEYVLDGTTQCSLSLKGGPTHGESLRAMMRQDPDIIVVGEIRDHETAALSVEAALTGHKVLTSYHTEDSVAAVIRLLEMGLEPFLVASTLGCIIAQRLVRRLCPHCAKPGAASARDLRYLGMTRDDMRSIMVMEADGCAACDGAGYRGRMGIHEVLVPDDDFRDAILRRAPSRELRELAKGLPAFMTLQEDGLLKVAVGRTSPSELANNDPRDVACRPMRSTL